jgi:hypothetical protein
MLRHQAWDVMVPTMCRFAARHLICMFAVPPTRFRRFATPLDKSRALSMAQLSSIKGHLETLTSLTLRFDTARSDSCNLTARYHSTTTDQAEPQAEPLDRL